MGPSYELETVPQALAAKALAELGDPRGAALCATLAADTTLGLHRVTAAKALADGMIRYRRETTRSRLAMPAVSLGDREAIT